LLANDKRLGVSVWPELWNSKLTLIIETATKDLVVKGYKYGVIPSTIKSFHSVQKFNLLWS